MYGQIWLHMQPFCLAVLHTIKFIFSDFFLLLLVPNLLASVLGLVIDANLSTGDVVGLFAGTDYSCKRGLVDYRVKRLVYACVLVLFENRFV